MKLYELINIEPQGTAKTRREYNNRINQRMTQELGSGSFGTVSYKDSPSKLNQVKKLGRAETHTAKYNDRNDNPMWEYAKSVDEDGYLSYIKMVINDKTHNQYFPRVINLQVKTDQSRDEIFYNIDLERLHSYNTLDSYVKNSIFNQMFTDDAHTRSSDIVGAIIGALNNEKINDFVKDPELKYALNKIMAVKNSNSDFFFDFNENNVMWRLTGTGPHLVITDPLA